MTILCDVYFVILLFFWKVNFLEPQILPGSNIHISSHVNRNQLFKTKTSLCLGPKYQKVIYI